LNPVAHAVGKVLSEGEKDEQQIKHKYDILNRFVDQYKKPIEKDIEELQKDEVEARKLNDKVERFFNVPKSFDVLEEDAQDMPAWSMAYINYAVPGLIGMSNSSPSQIMGNVL
jgi:hypothetical protein